MTFIDDHPKVVSQVDALVVQYRKLFPTEYRAVIDLVKDKRDNLLDPKTGSGLGADTLDRPLIEYPETLYSSIFNALSPEEFTQFFTKEGQRWFGGKYEEFRIPKFI